MRLPGSKSMRTGSFLAGFAPFNVCTMVGSVSPGWKSSKPQTVRPEVCDISMRSVSASLWNADALGTCHDLR